jgi:hypothetical protein
MANSPERGRESAVGIHVLLVFLHRSNWASCAASLTNTAKPLAYVGLRPGLVGCQGLIRQFFKLLATFLSAALHAGEGPADHVTRAARVHASWNHGVSFTFTGPTFVLVPLDSGTLHAFAWLCECVCIMTEMHVLMFIRTCFCRSITDQTEAKEYKEVCIPLARFRSLG